MPESRSCCGAEARLNVSMSCRTWLRDARQSECSKLVVQVEWLRLSRGFTGCIHWVQLGFGLARLVFGLARASGAGRFARRARRRRRPVCAGSTSRPARLERREGSRKGPATGVTPDQRWQTSLASAVPGPGRPARCPAPAGRSRRSSPASICRCRRPAARADFCTRLGALLAQRRCTAAAAVGMAFDGDLLSLRSAESSLALPSMVERNSSLTT